MEKTLRVRILKSESLSSWYKKEIGEEYDVYKKLHKGSYSIVKQPLEGVKFLIRKNDCKIL